MFAKALSFLGALAITGAAVLVTAEPAYAQPGYGYYGGYRGYYRPYYGGYYHHYYRPYNFPPYYTGYGYSYPGYANPYYGAYPVVPAEPTLTAEEKNIRALIAATGVSTGEGRLEWPLGLRILPGKETEMLRAQIDGLFQTAASQAARGQANANLVQEMAQAADKLHQRLRKDRLERASLTHFAYEEAERFLDKLTRAPQLLLVAPSAARN